MYRFRDMTLEDISPVVSIIAAYSKDDGRMAAHYYKRYFSNSSRLESEREQNKIGVLKSDGEIAGVIGFCPDKYDWPDILWLNWFYVAKKYRNRGLGSTLLNYTIEMARDIGVRKLYIDTSSDEIYADAINLYRKFGFKEEGRLIDYYTDGEDYLILGIVL